MVVLHEFLEEKYSDFSAPYRTLANEREQLRTEIWLGRQDSNLGMAESKSTWFALFINVHSEKLRKFGAKAIKRLAVISE